MTKFNGAVATFHASAVPGTPSSSRWTELGRQPMPGVSPSSFSLVARQQIGAGEGGQELLPRGQFASREPWVVPIDRDRVGIHPYLQQSMGLIDPSLEPKWQQEHRMRIRGQVEALEIPG